MAYRFLNASIDEVGEMLPRMLGKRFRLQEILSSITMDEVHIYVQERHRYTYKFVINRKDAYFCRNSTVLAIMKAVEFKTGEVKCLEREEK